MTLLQKLECTLLFGLLAACGCHSLTPAQQAKFDKFDCQVKAVEPLVSPALDAATLVKDLYAGKADLAAVLGSLGASKAEVAELLQRLKACEAPAPETLPAGDPS